MPFSGTHLHAICMTNCDVCRTCEQDVLVIIHIVSICFGLMHLCHFSIGNTYQISLIKWASDICFQQCIKLTGRSCLTWWDDIHKKYQDYQKLKWLLKLMPTTTFVLFSDASWPVGKYWGHISRYWDFMHHIVQWSPMPSNLFIWDLAPHYTW